MNITFSGIKTPYKTSLADVYPITQDITPSEMTKFSRGATSENLLGSGCNGEVYAYGKDLVIKRTKPHSLVRESVLREAKKLNMLYHLAQENGIYLENSQAGVGCFKFQNGPSYLISTRVKGKEMNPADNPFTKRNLSSLMRILTSLDKGSKRYGRLMVYDLNSGNYNLTPNQAGVFDIEYMGGTQYKDYIQRILAGKYDKRNPHLSDTSYMPSNVRSFEWGSFQYYLKELPDEEAQKVFKTYLQIKSTYHREMAQYYLSKSKNAIYPQFFIDLVKKEIVHAKLLGKKKPAKDIVKSEAIKIQMANYIFITSRSCNGYFDKLNIPQITKYYETGLSYFEEELEKAKSTNDTDRITYYTNCINIFKTWEDVKNVSKQLKPTQRERLWDVREKTLDEKVI